MIIPSLHRQPVALNLQTHRLLRLKPLPPDHGHASTSNALFVVGGEIGHAARDFAIVFIEAGKDAQGRAEIAPVAVCGVAKDENLYVDGGQWRARYVPAVLQLYPFCFGHVEGEQYALGIDAACSALSQSEGQALFDAAGQLTPLVNGALQTLQQFDADSRLTRQLCAQLRDLGLLQPSRFDATLEDGSKLTVDGFFTVDEKKLGALPDADVVALHKVGALGMVHAHYVSLGNLNKLAEWHVQRHKAAAAAPSASA